MPFNDIALLIALVCVAGMWWQGKERRRALIRIKAVRGDRSVRRHPRWARRDTVD